MDIRSKSKSMRRKSSSFRPHNWIYPTSIITETNTIHVSLESLPIVILESIFDYLQTPDLLQLCLVSRYFYLPAANRLYQKISITEDYLSIAYVRDQMRNWNRNFCTVITPANIPKLLAVVMQNEKLAAMVHSITITDTKKVSLVPNLIACLRLKSFHYAGLLDIPSIAASTIQEMTCFLPSACVYVPNLYELKINHPNKKTDFAEYEKLALSMVESNSYQNLKKLVFEHMEEKNLHSLNLYNNERSDVSPQPAWTAFFNVFSQRKIKLNLMALGLDGFLRNAGESTAQLINSAVQLSELLTLELKYKELSHSGQAHRDDSTTFLESVTRYTSSLQYLSINPTDNCLTCQIEAIIQTLRENVPNQLKNLRIKIEPRTYGDTENIERTILTHQGNLVKLKFEDRSNSWHELGLVLFDLKTHQHTQWHDDIFYGEKSRKAFTSCILDIEEPRPYVNEGKVESIKICREAILNFLKSNSVYQQASKYLPFLTEYCVLDLYINMREKGVFANGEIILLQ
ncbi:hypothetical protein JCM33374_g4954 [Metschnikowia sp. JCM 33374]|nr:hypothetical protein JCM33374_g4954 [Metschnikowia sp. JCM 33374]